MPFLSPPEFWSRPGLMPSVLEPAAQVYAALGAARRAFVTPYRAPVPVLCVGNLVVGGAGKTPVVASMVAMLTRQGRHPAVLSRGYGGSATGPLQVDRDRHDAAIVGDEPLLLARGAPVWVGRDRAATAQRACAAGADCLVMDDGFQNFGIVKDLSLVVVDGTYGFGNGHVMPAGPLREPATVGLARADAIVMMGDDRVGLATRLPKPVLHASLVPLDGADFAGKTIVAFAGIARPERFFASLEACGARLAARHRFPDHYAYRDTDLQQLGDEAAVKGALLATTEKDHVRLPPGWQKRVTVLRVGVAWRDDRAVERLVERLFHAV